MAATPTTTTRQSLALLDHLTRVARREAESLLGGLGLRPLHVVALTLLRSVGATTQQSLAEGLRLDPSNLVGLLNELESLGLVSRTRDPADRRRHIVRLEPEGAARLAEAERTLAVVEDRLLGSLSAAERDTLHALLVRAAGDQVPGGACAPPDADAC